MGRSQQVRSARSFSRNGLYSSKRELAIQTILPLTIDFKSFVELALDTKLDLGFHATQSETLAIVTTKMNNLMFH
jgi:hypothetical protein